MKVTPMEVTLLDHMGSDLTVTNAARVSFSKHHDEFDEQSDSRLIKYLATHNHWTPFAHCFAQFRIKAPIFVARQLVKHQVGLVWNEESRRYIDSEVEIYLPHFWRKRAENVKQGSSREEVKPNSYGTGVCVRCGTDVPRKSAGPRGKWCSEKCRAQDRRENDPDFRIGQVKYNAEKRGLEFSIERGDVEWPTHCPILGIALDYTGSEGKNPDAAPSIDRIDTSKGYVKGNVWVISNKANRMKNDGSREELIQFARSILLTFNGQIVPESGSVEATCAHMVEHYYWLLDQGVAPEQARMVLPLNTHTEWYWSGSLAAFARVCKLRLDPHAQAETREIAEGIDKHLRGLFPVSWEALVGGTST